jgi:predicted amidohydrolase
MTTVAVVQIGPCAENISDNVERGVRLVEQAAARGADVVVLPETFSTVFFAVETRASFDHYFETVPGPTTERLGEVARSRGCAVVAGIAEKTESGRYYNSAVVIDSGGALVGRYRKLHLPLMVTPPERATYEASYFSPGDLGLPVFDVDGIRLGVVICYDRHFPETFRTLAMRGAEVVAVPTAARTWRAGWRSEIWECLLRTRAYENGIFVAAANRAGEENGTGYLGDSMVVSPKGGTVLARSAPEALDDVVLAECDLDEVRAFRQEVPFRRDLRPEVYAPALGIGGAANAT